MSKSLEKEYRQMMNEDLPDLWDRISDSLPEKKTKRISPFKIAGPIAAAVCAAIIIPAVISSGRDSKSASYATDQAAETAYNDKRTQEAAAEAEGNAYNEAEETAEAVAEAEAEEEAYYIMDGTSVSGGEGEAGDTVRVFESVYLYDIVQDETASPQLVYTAKTDADDIYNSWTEGILTVVVNEETEDPEAVISTLSSGSATADLYGVTVEDGSICYVILRLSGNADE
ncbi:MAG: hypothetical protein IJH99_10335 [Eubacterium sp.]|nr:hypothetical protein [Eubacterium sp.]